MQRSEPSMSPEQEIIVEIQNIAKAMHNICHLAQAHNLGATEWFCDGYPFGEDLDEVFHKTLEYVDTLTTNLERIKK